MRKKGRGERGVSRERKKEVGRGDGGEGEKERWWGRKERKKEKE